MIPDRVISFLERRKTMTKKYCPQCNSIVETRIDPTGYKQVPYRNIVMKRRKIAHRRQEGGCGHTWYTFEVSEGLMQHMAPTLFHPEWEI